MSPRAAVLLSSLLLLASACRRTEAQSSKDAGTPSATADAATQARVDLRNDVLSHRTPYIPPQCYTKTRGAQGRIHNPCFVCHQSSRAPNYIDDAALQLDFAFPAVARRNPWANLFVDRRKAIAAMPDAELLAYVRQSNYLAPDGAPALARTLQKVPKDWDLDGNGRWDGWSPDIAFRFDERGFDVRPDGSLTGWRAFAYYPFPGTFWPTNGSFGDVLIRLPEAFRQDENGQADVTVYTLNLAILEALVARRDVPIEPLEEKRFGVDLDGDGKLATAKQVRYLWKPPQLTMSWVGRARALQQQEAVHLAAGLFPEDTEFAHTVRYLDVVEGKPRMAARLKELRYMVKKGWISYGAFMQAASREAREAEQTPDKTRALGGVFEQGVGNGAGWRLQGFIEDAQGQLRPQSREEHAFCLGCHSGVGATDDSVFSFGRKLPASEFQAGWFHWSQRGLEGVREPVRADGHGEYAYYLKHNGAGDELRANTEVLERFFNPDGALRPEAAQALREDISTLLLPSPERAIQLDKAYRLIVREQSFTRGRDAILAPADNVHRELPADGPEMETGVSDALPGPREGKLGPYPGLLARPKPEPSKGLTDAR
ncbi:hypothetical protein [Hyalangium rubrum]|uniref:Lipoprotein n=1 Tax=Hyalangium rubrum TaxID=3103134 RepID=A0ABU5GZX7_9BACT|nr:hypothetical protein [Hyalangium sp. s54d21]MDY7225400.1 hypothetical protein [Hyalangium sp. s54d21]